MMQLPLHRVGSGSICARTESASAVERLRGNSGARGACCSWSRNVRSAVCLFSALLAIQTCSARRHCVHCHHQFEKLQCSFHVPFEEMALSRQQTAF